MYICSTIPYHTVPWLLLPWACLTIPCHTILPYNTIPCHTIPSYHTILYHTMLPSTEHHTLTATVPHSTRARGETSPCPAHGGHLARMPETRVQRQLLRCWRLQPGRAAGGCKFLTLLGLFGKTDGVYGALVRTHLTPAVRRRFFGSGAPRQWFVNAQRRLTWRRFVGAVYVK